MTGERESHYASPEAGRPRVGSGLRILTYKEGALVGDSVSLVTGPNGRFLVSTTLRDTHADSTRQQLVVDDIYGS